MPTMPYAVECLLLYMKFINIVPFAFVKYLSHCGQLIKCSSSWPEPGSFFSKCHFNILLHSVLYQFSEDFPCKVMPLKCLQSRGSPSLLYIGMIVNFTKSSGVSSSCWIFVSR